MESKLAGAFLALLFMIGFGGIHTYIYLDDQAQRAKNKAYYEPFIRYDAANNMNPPQPIAKN